MKNSIIAMGAVGAVILGTVALAQTTVPPGQNPPPATSAGDSQTGVRTTTPPDRPMTDRNTPSSSSMNNNGYGAGAQTSSTAMPYNNQTDSTMAGGAQTSMQDGSASQWAGERG